MNWRLWRLRARRIGRRLWRAHGRFLLRVLAWCLVGFAIGRSNAWVGDVVQAYLIIGFCLFALLRVTYARGKQAGIRSVIDSHESDYRYSGPPRTVRRLEVVR